MIELPQIGLGTWEHTDRENCVESVRLALDMGYRHVDTAQVYGTEPYVREGIERADVPREDVFLATKVHEDDPGPGYDEFREATENRLDALGIDVLDLLYVHWPIKGYDAETTLSALEAVADAGLTRHLGVSNFTPELLDEALDVLDRPLFANQVEMHPFLRQPDLVEHAQEHDYHLVAYSPLARGDVLENDVIRDIAAKHDASPAQVSLSWLLSKDNVAAVPKATGEAHLRDNLQARDLTLDKQDVERIETIDRRERYVDRPGAPWNQ